MRLDKFVADALGVTRSEAKSIIRRGEITVDGRVASSASMHIDCEEVRFKGDKITPEEYVYLMMNKPAGYLSATEDKRQKTVLDLLDPRYGRYGLFPAGRLDKDAEGFLLLTNDGRLAHSVLSPKKKIGKTYFVRLALPLGDAEIDILENGTDIGGRVTAPARVERLGDGEALITITEGKYHQVKKMFASVGNRVEYLKRVSFAGLSLDEGLALGEYRPLSPEELEKILLTVQ